MLKLQCLGTLAVVTAREVGPSAGQLRRLALLAALAPGAERPTSRESLLALLWPEQDDARARQALSQAIYALRRDLGEEELLLGQRELRLNPAVVACDVWDFRRALAAGDDAEAVESYPGDFLDGVHIGQGGEFARWADEIRQQLRSQRDGALERLASAASGRGEHATALEWWLRLAAADPLSHRWALQVAQGYQATGDRAAALRAIRRHEERTTAEIGIGLDPALQALRERLETPSYSMPAIAPGSAPNRMEGATAPAAANRSQRRGRERGDAPRIVAPALGRVGRAGAAPAAEPVSPASAPSRAGRRVLLGVGAAVAVAIAAVTLPALRGAPAGGGVEETRAPAPVTVLALAPLEYVGPPGDAFKGRVVERLLEANLASMPRMQLADSVGPAQGATLRGAVVVAADDGSVTASLKLSTATSTPPITLRAESRSGDLTDVADALSRQVIAELAGPEASTALVAAASRTTHSLPALRHFVDGDELFAAGRWKEAADAFARAVALDSTFALASYRLSEAANWNGDVTTQQAAAGRAWRMRDGLPQRERLMVEANWAWNSGDIGSAERGFRDAVSKYPFDPEGWYQLGEVIFHSGPVFGRPAQLGRAAYERVVALASGKRKGRRVEAYLHLARIAGVTGDLVAFDSLYRILRPLSGPTDLQELNTMLACVRGDAAAVAAMRAELASANSVALLANARRCAVYGGSLALAARTYAEIPRSALDPTAALAVRIEEAALHAAAGEASAARAGLGGESTDDGASLLLHRALLAWALGDVPNDELRALRDSIDAGFPRRAPTGVVEVDRAFGLVGDRFAPLVAGLLDVRLGDRRSVRRHVRALRAPGGDAGAAAASRNFAHTILAALALADREPAAALAHLDSLEAVPVIPQLEFLVYRAHERLLQARALAALGRHAEAAAVAQTLGQRSPFEFTLLPAATRLAHDALAAAGQGDSAQALLARQEGRGVKVARR